jgi:hypothetical protein
LWNLLHRIKRVAEGLWRLSQQSEGPFPAFVMRFAILSGPVILTAGNLVNLFVTI